MGRIRKWMYLGLGMVAWRAGKYYMRRKMHRRGDGTATDAPGSG